MDRKDIKQDSTPPPEITPYKLSILMKQAQKIVNQCASVPQWLISYEEMEFLLEMVLDAIKKTKEINKNALHEKD